MFFINSIYLYVSSLINFTASYGRCTRCQYCVVRFYCAISFSTRKKRKLSVLRTLLRKNWQPLNMLVKTNLRRTDTEFKSNEYVPETMPNKKQEKWQLWQVPDTRVTGYRDKAIQSTTNRGNGGTMIIANNAPRGMSTPDKKLWIRSQVMIS